MNKLGGIKMKINGMNPISVANIYNKNSNTVNRVEKTEKVEKKDTIEISQLGRALTNYSVEGTVDNSAKVQRIKEQIQNGTYNVDAKLTAQSIIDAIKGNKA